MTRASILFDIPKLKHSVGTAVDVEPDPARVFADWIERAGDESLAARIREAALRLQKTAEARVEEESDDPEQFLSETITLTETEAGLAREALEMWVGRRSGLRRLYEVLHQIHDLEENPPKSDLKSPTD